MFGAVMALVDHLLQHRLALNACIYTIKVAIMSLEIALTAVPARKVDPECDALAVHTKMKCNVLQETIQSRI